MTSYGIRFANVASCTLNPTVENNIVVGAVTSSGTIITVCFDEITFNTGTKTFNYNISSDTSADDFSGSGHQLNARGGQIWADESSLAFTLLSTSLALDMGKTILAVTTDMVGVSRPQGDKYDIGPLEYVVSPADADITYSTRRDFDDIDGGKNLYSEAISEYHYVADTLIDGPIGQDCQITYPVTKNSVCPNCIYSARKRKSSNIYKKNENKWNYIFNAEEVKNHLIYNKLYTE